MATGNEAGSHFAEADSCKVDCICGAIHASSFILLLVNGLNTARKGGKSFLNQHGKVWLKINKKIHAFDKEQ